MIEKTVNGKTAFKRVLCTIKTNPAYILDNGAETLSVIFDIPIHVVGTKLRKESDGFIFSILEVDWKTALSRVLNRYKEVYGFGSADGIEALMIVFDLPKKTVREEFKRETIRMINERSSSRM